jgi:hypothetical protein
MTARNKAPSEVPTTKTQLPTLLYHRDNERETSGRGALLYR